MVILSIVPVLPLAVLAAFLIVAIIRATKSSTDISEFVKTLLPAGNCLCQSSTIFDCRLSRIDEHQGANGLHAESSISTEGNWQFQYERDAHNLGLNTEQCNIAFPGLFEEIHRAVDVRSERRSNVSAADLAAVVVGRGTTRALIVNGKLRVVGAKHPDEIQRKKGLAILYAISRAISSMDGRAIPNIEFVFSIDDMVENPNQPIWTLARRSQDHNLWLMPDFGFWSWDIQDLGTLDDVTEQIMRNEDAVGWGGKIQKLIWRGQLQMLPRLRRALVDVSKGKPWGDVAALIPQNYMSAADQCKYMFVAHAEGRSYSGSLKYRQLCHSVIIIHKMQWIQHHHYLLVANGPQQNFVEVERDFSDLAAKMGYLISHPEETKRIADNSIRTFRERYFAPAAEACYWRALIRGWAASSFQPEVFVSSPEGDLRPRGMPFETFALLESQKQIEFKWDKVS
ncbi:hypothetical protein OIDMADRAFT_135960 [Oidiodendron maius Zn]|uniref:Glycosyl transferase CAP10 domain-containing protein n=1 Tax=Oidiodendron maius (strain Zn) TaxID=913774 RepID=A0A0C3GVM8_OIDMZ|nr:hypothetical protein OIDMADRAFT_135960 [Oidiodendron maius Zn]